MHPTILAMFVEGSGTAVAMCTASLALFLIGVLAAKSDIAAAHGLDKIVALSNLCFAVPLAVFGTLHLFGPQFVKDLVPPYMPWRMFWVYFVGCALIAASLSIATKIAVRWSGLLVGIMMFLFVAMLYLPSGLRHLHARITWTIVFRESSFGGAGWLLAGTAINGWRRPAKSTLINVGRVCVTMALIVFGIEHFLHPTGLPGVPLQRQMAAWIPGRVLIDYLTGAALLIAAGSILLRKKTRVVTTCVAGWLLLLILVIYVPVMIASLFEPGLPAKIEGINYFADTLLFAGVILSVAAQRHALKRPRRPPFRVLQRISNLLRKTARNDMSTPAVHRATQLTGIAPQFLVNDLDQAIVYYCDKLGFQLDFKYESFYASVSRDGFAIHLKCAPKHASEREHRKENEHLDAYISVSGIQGLFSELQMRGAQVIRPLEQRPWACLDFYVEDPDGYILCFSEPNA